MPPRRARRVNAQGDPVQPKVPNVTVPEKVAKLANLRRDPYGDYSKQARDHGVLIPSDVNTTIRLLPEEFRCDILRDPEVTRGLGLNELFDARYPVTGLQRSPPTEPGFPESNAEITMVECGITDDSLTDRNLAGKPAFLRVNPRSVGKPFHWVVKGGQAIGGGQIIFKRGWATQDLKILVPERKTQYWAWKREAMKAYWEARTEWEIARLSWEAQLVWECARQNLAVQWHPRADPNAIREMTPTSIMTAAFAKWTLLWGARQAMPLFHQATTEPLYATNMKRRALALRFKRHLGLPDDAPTPDPDASEASDNGEPQEEPDWQALLDAAQEEEDDAEDEDPHSDDGSEDTVMGG